MFCWTGSVFKYLENRYSKIKPLRGKNLDHQLQIVKPMSRRAQTLNALPGNKEDKPFLQVIFSFIQSAEELE